MYDGKGQVRISSRPATRRVAAPNTAHEPIAKRGVVAFLLVQFGHVHDNFRGSEQKVCHSATQLACRTVIIRGGILNIAERARRERGCQADDREFLHVSANQLTKARRAVASLILPWVAEFAASLTRKWRW